MEGKEPTAEYECTVLEVVFNRPKFHVNFAKFHEVP